MEVILKEKIKNIGNIGDIVSVKKGFAKNFLIPNNKALYATPNNVELLNQQKDTLEKESSAQLEIASKLAESLNNKPFIFIRSASEAGALYGSVTSKNIADSLLKGNITISSSQIKINQPIKTIGVYNIELELHSDVTANLVIIVARSNEDAEIMFKSYMNTNSKKTIDASENETNIANTKENTKQDNKTTDQ